MSNRHDIEAGIAQSSLDQALAEREEARRRLQDVQLELQGVRKALEDR